MAADIGADGGRPKGLLSLSNELLLEIAHDLSALGSPASLCYLSSTCRQLRAPSQEALIQGATLQLTKVKRFNLTLMRNPVLASKIKRLTIVSWDGHDKEQYEEVTEEYVYWLLWKDSDALARINISIQEWDWAFDDGAVDLAKHVAILLALVPHVEELAFEADVPEKIPFLGQFDHEVRTNHYSPDESFGMTWQQQWDALGLKPMTQRITSLDFGMSHSSLRIWLDIDFSLFPNLQFLSIAARTWHASSNDSPPTLKTLQLNHCDDLPAYFGVIQKYKNLSVPPTIRLLLSSPLETWIERYRLSEDFDYDKAVVIARDLGAYQEVLNRGISIECYSPSSKPLFRWPRIMRSRPEAYYEAYYENTPSSSTHPADTRMRYVRVDLHSALVSAGAIWVPEQERVATLTQGYQYDDKDVNYLQHQPLQDSNSIRAKVDDEWVKEEAELQKRGARIDVGSSRYAEFSYDLDDGDMEDDSDDGDMDDSFEEDVDDNFEAGTDDSSDDDFHDAVDYFPN